MTVQDIRLTFGAFALAALLLPGVAGADQTSPIPTNLPPAEKRDVPTTAVLMLSTRCPDTTALEKVGSHVVAEVRTAGRLNELDAKIGISEAERAALKTEAISLMEAGKKNYFENHFPEARRQLLLSTIGFPGHRVPLEKDAKRWAQFDEAVGYLALATRAAGNSEEYQNTIGWLASIRPTAAFGVTFSPGFRKDFEDAVDRAGHAPTAPLEIKTSIGTWRVRIDGVDRGNATMRTVSMLPTGNHYIGFVHPDGTIRYTMIELSEAGIRHFFDPIAEAVVKRDGYSMICMPAESELSKDDGWKSLAASQVRSAAEVITTYPAPGGYMLVLGMIESREVKSAMLLPAADAGDGAKVAALVRSLYAPTTAPGTPAPGIEASVKLKGDSVLRKWWFWTAVGVVAGAAIGVPVYLFRRDENGSTLGAVTVKP